VQFVGDELVYISFLSGEAGRIYCYQCDLKSHIGEPDRTDFDDLPGAAHHSPSPLQSFQCTTALF